MRNKAYFFLSIIAVSSLIAGCAGPEQKFSRGLNNTVEFARMGELRRSMEQSAVFGAPGGITMGFFRGVDRSMLRTGAGLYEVVTFPIPNGRYGDYGAIYHPDYGHGAIDSANPVYPDSYQPDWLADSLVQPDTSLGFAGGDVAPYLPGSRFRIFDN